MTFCKVVLFNIFKAINKLSVIQQLRINNVAIAAVAIRVFRQSTDVTHGMIHSKKRHNRSMHYTPVMNTGVIGFNGGHPDAFYGETASL